MELLTKEKIEVINAKLKQYNLNIYSLKVDMTCADALEDEQWKENIREKTKHQLKLIEVLEKQLEELEA